MSVCLSFLTDFYSVQDAKCTFFLHALILMTCQRCSSVSSEICEKNELKKCPFCLRSGSLYYPQYNLVYLPLFAAQYNVKYILESRSLKKSGLKQGSHRYRGGHGFESRWSPDFFRLLLSNCLKLENLLRLSQYVLPYTRTEKKCQLNPNIDTARKIRKTFENSPTYCEHFGNSLIIRQVKTKKITTVKEVWIPGLN